MSSPLLPLASLLVLLAVILWSVPRHAPGPAWARQALLASLLVASVGAFGAWSIPRYGPGARDGWTAGELRADGLRIAPSGRPDASAVLDPADLEHPRAREVYAIAREIPGVLNRLYCWCGCVDRGRHRSALACFEDASAAGCGVCQETARIAMERVRGGVTDAARIQRAVDLEWAPPGRVSR